MKISKINIRQLDVWGIYRDPEHLGVYKTVRKIRKQKRFARKKKQPYVDTAFDIITKAYKKRRFKKPVEVVTNCVSKFTINGEEIQRHFDTLVIAKEADIVIMLSSDLRDQELGVNAKDIIDYLDKAQIPYEVGVGEMQNDTDDPTIPEIWFAREEAVLVMGLEEAVELRTKNISFDPDAVINLSLGYYDSKDGGKYKELWGVNGRGLVKSDNNWIVIIDEQYDKNMSSERVQEVVEEAQKKL